MDLWHERIGLEVQPVARAPLVLAGGNPMLITILLAIVILALVLYALQLLPLDAMITRILQLLVVILAVVYLIERFGVV
jgi:hypothetical protein